MLYLSRLTKQKGVDILIDAWSSMSQNERNGHSMDCRNWAHGAGLSDTQFTSESELHHLGLVDEAEKSWLLNNASDLAPAI